MKDYNQKLNGESGNSMIENAIILPLIFLVIFSLIFFGFVLSERAALEAAAKRGAVYAAHCISNPNYASILANSGNESGGLEVSVSAKENKNAFNFTGIGSNIQPYRYITNSSSSDIDYAVEREIKGIIGEGKLALLTVELGDIHCKTNNYFVYQSVEVSIEGKMPLPKLFGILGIDTNYTVVANAKMAVNDPDEFIRNADLVIDVIAKFVDLNKVTDKIQTIGKKLTDWIGFAKK